MYQRAATDEEQEIIPGGDGRSARSRSGFQHEKKPAMAGFLLPEQGLVVQRFVAGFFAGQQRNQRQAGHRGQIDADVEQTVGVR